jgi:hypothetical protein
VPPAQTTVTINVVLCVTASGVYDLGRMNINVGGGAGGTVVVVGNDGDSVGSFLLTVL